MNFDINNNYNINNINTINSANNYYEYNNNFYNFNYQTNPNYNMFINTNMNYNNIYNNVNKEIKNKIVVRFTDDIAGKSLYITIDRNKKISELINKYRNKTGDYDFSEKFLFDAKMLDENLTCEEAKLYDYANINIIYPTIIGGAEENCLKKK